MCSGSEAGSYARLIYFVYHSTPGLRVIKKKVRGVPAVAITRNMSPTPNVRSFADCVTPCVQGYLAHKKMPPPGTLQ